MMKDVLLALFLVSSPLLASDFIEFTPAPCPEGMVDEAKELRFEFYNYMDSHGMVSLSNRPLSADLVDGLLVWDSSSVDPDTSTVSVQINLRPLAKKIDLKRKIYARLFSTPAPIGYPKFLSECVAQ